MAKILNQIETVLSNFPAKSVSDILPALEKVARSDPKNPGPHLAMAMLTSVSRYDFGEARRHLQTAGQLMEHVTDKDPETQFSRSLYQVLRNEFQLVELAKSTGEHAADTELKRLVEVQAGSGEAIQQIQKLLKQLPDSNLAKTIYAALRCLSRTIAVGSTDYRGGTLALGKLGASGNSTGLANFLLIYAHRRARRYPQATRVAQQLEKRCPDSALIKRTTASCYYFSRKYAQADQYLKQAKVLSPRDPSILLDHARVLTRMNKLDEAQQMLQQSISLDPQHQYEAFRKDIMGTLKLQERFRSLS